LSKEDARGIVRGEALCEGAKRSNPLLAFIPLLVRERARGEGSEERREERGERREERARGGARTESSSFMFHILLSTAVAAQR
jgi:hypothetical protein